MWDLFALPQLLSIVVQLELLQVLVKISVYTSSHSQCSAVPRYARVQSLLYVLLSVCQSRTVVHPRVPARHCYQVANTAMFLYTASVGSKAGVARGRETKNWHNQGFNRGWQMQEMGRVYLSQDFEMSVPRQPCNNNKNMVWMIGSLVHNQTNRPIKTMYRKLIIVIFVQLHKKLNY